jgi:citrate synthase
VNNTIAATEFKKISAPPAPGEREEIASDKGLRVSDKGFLNTAVISSDITYIDGEAGGKISEPLPLAIKYLQCLSASL